VKKQTGLFAIVVTFNPEIAPLRRLLEIINTQVQAVVVIDNGSMNIHDWATPVCSQFSNCILLRQQKNLGIAEAQNIGIQYANQAAASHVILFDQDSEPSRDMIEKLMSASFALTKLGHKVACVGPNYLDTRQNNQPPFIRIEGLRLIRADCSSGEFVPVDYLIASGSLILCDCLSQVGLMRESLFIDYVDIEWGLRAKTKGFQSFGVCNARMKHRLGDSPVVFLGKTIPIHSPLRHYYHFRNAVTLYKDSSLPVQWKIVDCWRLVLKYVAYSIIAKPRASHWKMMTIGIFHGIIGRAGAR
jgi:rhamnosyltransferase